MFEMLGKLFFSKMRLFFFFSLLLFPLILAAFCLLWEAQNLQELQTRYTSALKKEQQAIEKKGRKEKFLARYSHPDPYFLDHQIESFPLLEREKSKLLSLKKNPAYPDSSILQSRLKEIEDNTLSFIESKIITKSELKETQEKQRNFVQVDQKDLQNLLFLIEDIKQPQLTKRPQLIIESFCMRKVNTSLKTEVFEIKMDLLKREFTK